MTSILSRGFGISKKSRVISSFLVSARDIKRPAFSTVTLCQKIPPVAHPQLKVNTVKINSIFGSRSFYTASCNMAHESFKKHGVVSDVCDSEPKSLLKVKYGSVEVKCGETYTPTQVQNPPEVTWDAEDGAFYTLIMNDPDAPSRADPKFGEWHHWMVVNIPGNKVSEGEARSEYIGAGPPEGTGLHRYVFMVYKQPGKMTFDGVPKLTRKVDQRNNQKLKDFLKTHKLGPQAEAGIFFQAEYDDYVPLLYKSLGA